VFAHVEAPIAAGSLITTEGRVWSQDGRLLASGASQLLSTPVPPA
jgi:acyl-CoA thioesterase